MWREWSTRPGDGTFFVCWNGTQMKILNEPPECCLGYWEKHKDEWFGAMVRFDGGTHWMPLPAVP